MAEDEAEKAFFQAQAMNAGSGEYNATEVQGADSSDSDDYDPSKTLQDEYSASLTNSKPSENISPIPAPSDPSPSNQTSFLSETGPSQQASGAYTSQISPQAESQASASVPPSGAPMQSKTRTIGGFVVEDEDEDDQRDADYEPPAVLGVEDMNTTAVNLPQTFSGNANQSTSTPDVSLQDAEQNPVSSQNVPNSSYSVAAVSKNDVSSLPGQVSYNSPALQSGNVPGSPASTPASAPPSASRGRLPHDRVGILEDRIQEDPRGDIPAWLELISEHRSRNRIDSARDVYERFLKVFPSAVSISSLPIFDQ